MSPPYARTPATYKTLDIEQGIPDPDNDHGKGQDKECNPDKTGIEFPGFLLDPRIRVQQLVPVNPVAIHQKGYNAMAVKNIHSVTEVSSAWTAFWK